MKPFHIDFADAPGAWRWDWSMPATRIAALLLLVALVSGALALQRGLTLRGATAQARAAQLEHEAARERSARMIKSAARLGAEDEALLHQASMLRAIPWEGVFRAFEAAPPAVLQSFEPDLARGVVKLQAHVADLGAAQDYLAGLRRSPVFLRVSLLRHEVATEGGVDFHAEAVLAGPYRLPEPEQRGAK
ncbi:MAG: hypothetical protein ABIT83_16495 [Massilia sp.]